MVIKDLSKKIALELDKEIVQDLIYQPCNFNVGDIIQGQNGEKWEVTGVNAAFGSIKLKPWAPNPPQRVLSRDELVNTIKKFSEGPRFANSYTIGSMDTDSQVYYLAGTDKAEPTLPGIDAKYAGEIEGADVWIVDNVNDARWFFRNQNDKKQSMRFHHGSKTEKGRWMRAWGGLPGLIHFMTQEQYNILTAPEQPVLEGMDTFDEPIKYGGNLDGADIWIVDNPKRAYLHFMRGDDSLLGRMIWWSSKLARCKEVWTGRFNNCPGTTHFMTQDQYDALTAPEQPTLNDMESYKGTVKYGGQLDGSDLWIVVDGKPSQAYIHFKDNNEACTWWPCASERCDDMRTWWKRDWSDRPGRNHFVTQRTFDELKPLVV